MESRPYVLLPYAPRPAHGPLRKVVFSLAVAGLVVGLLALGIAALSLAGCASTAVHPGAVNTFDSQAWDDIASVQAGIESARAAYLADMSPAKDHRQAAVINDAARACNSVKDLYLLWTCAQSTTTISSADATKREEICINHRVVDANQVPDPVAIRAEIAKLLAAWGRGAATGGSR